MYIIKLIKQIPKLSAVRKVLEIIVFLALGSFGTLGPKLSYGTSEKFANVRTHLRKVSRIGFYLIKNTEDLILGVLTSTIISRVLQVLLALFCLILLFLSTNSYKLCRSQPL